MIQRERRTRAGVVFLGLMVLSCGDDDSAFLDEAYFDGECTDGEASRFIRDVSQEWYLYREQLPELDVASFDTQRSYLAALVENVDLAPNSPNVQAADRFSFITSVQSFEVSSTGNFVGIGIRYRIEDEDVEGERGLRLVDVLGATERENPTPAGEAGLNRADRIVAINGRSVQSIIDERDDDQSEGAAVSEAMGPGEEGARVDFTVIRPDGTQFEASIVRRPIEQSEVPVAQVFERDDDKRIGYMVFRRFTPSSAEDLRRAAIEFEEAGVTDLIVDLRYNGGGRIAVANYMADLIYGTRAEGETFNRTVYNDLNSDRTRSLFFGSPECPDDSGCQGDSTGLTQIESLTFITTGSTASASEMLINGLGVYLPVRIVGSASLGKPVGFLSFEHSDCDQVYAPVTLKTVNANDDGDFFDGFPVDCPAEDDITRRLGDEQESSLSAALSLIDTGECPTDGVGLSLRQTAVQKSYAEVEAGLRWW